MRSTERFFHACIAALVFCGFAAVAGAQAPQYPSKPIRVIVPYSPGGADTQIRALAPFLTARLGQSLVIENVTGAGGIIAANQVRSAAPDGYTIFFTGTAVVTMLPNMNKDVTFRLADFAPIGNIAGIPNVLAVRADVPYTVDVATFRKYASANPGKLNLGSAGTGTLTHILGALVMYTGDLRFTHIPFKGVADAVQAMIGGNVDLVLGIPSVMVPQARAGKLRALATTGATRSEFLPDVPTMREAGFDFVDLSRFGLFAPKGVPDAVIQRLTTALEDAVRAPEYQALMQKSFTSLLYHSPSEYRAILEAEDLRWRTLLGDPKFAAAMK